MALGSCTFIHLIVGFALTCDASLCLVFGCTKSMHVVLYLTCYNEGINGMYIATTCSQVACNTLLFVEVKKASYTLAGNAISHSWVKGKEILVESGVSNRWHMYKCRIRSGNICLSLLYNFSGAMQSYPFLH